MLLLPSAMCALVHQASHEARKHCSTRHCPCRKTCLGHEQGVIYAGILSMLYKPVDCCLKSICSREV